MKGCIGGDHTRAFSYIQKNGGLDTEKSYPYTGKDEKCHYDKENLGDTINVVVTLPTGDETSLLEAVAQVDNEVMLVASPLLFCLQRPVSVAIDSKQLQSYDQGVFSSKECHRSPKEMFDLNKI